MRRTRLYVSMRETLFVAALLVVLSIGFSNQKAFAQESCYDLGNRFGRCSYASLSGRRCSPEDDIVIPARCRGQADTQRGNEAGIKVAGG